MKPWRHAKMRCEGYHHFSGTLSTELNRSWEEESNNGSPSGAWIKHRHTHTHTDISTDRRTFFSWPHSQSDDTFIEFVCDCLSCLRWKKEVFHFSSGNHWEHRHNVAAFCFSINMIIALHFSVHLVAFVFMKLSETALHGRFSSWLFCQ